MKKLIALLFAFNALAAFAGSETNYYYQLAQSGNQAYEQGEYDSAITLYSKVVNANFASPNLFYNLGNSYFKTNNLAPSIYYLEKAHKLAPFDKDIEFNLNMARSQITDRINSVPQPIVVKVWSYVRNLMSIDSWAILCVVAFMIFVVLIGFYLLSASVALKKLAFFTSFGFLLTALLSITSGLSAYNYVKSENQAVVFAGSLSVKAEPKSSSADLFIVHEGTTVNVLEEVNKWVRVSLPDGNEGWAPLEDVKRF